MGEHTTPLMAIARTIAAKDVGLFFAAILPLTDDCPNLDFRHLLLVGTQHNKVDVRAW
jgi:hypothetical protein